MLNDMQDDEMIDAAVQARLFDLMTCLPGIVQAYYPGNADRQPRADVLPITGTLQDGVPVPFPVLPDVPVAFPKFGDGSMTWPLPKGSPVTLVFSSRAISAFAVDGIEGDPQSARAQHLADAICLPIGILPVGAGIADASDIDVRITAAAGGKIKLSPGLTSAGVARTGDAVTAATAMNVWISKLTVIGHAIDPTLIAPTDFGTITGGSATVTAGD